MSLPLLALDHVCAGYGRGDIVHDVDLRAQAEHITTIIGPNGAGKSTLIKAIAGVVTRSAGSIRIGGEEIGGLPASEVARQGVAYVPQEANVFRSLTVMENLEMGAWILPEQKRERLDAVFTLFPTLAERRRTRAGNLSGGQRQMVAFGMALMVAPMLLLLDEPSAGLAPNMVEHMFETIQLVNRGGTAVLMVEQNAVQALQISHYGIVMAGGQVKLADRAAFLLDSEEVGELYLGAKG